MVEVTVSEKLDDWTNFYEGLLGTTVLFDDLDLPEPRPGFDRLIVVLSCLTIEQLHQKCLELFPCWEYNPWLDSDILTNDRTADNGTYAIWVRDGVEADEGNKNRSAAELMDVGVPGMTLLERLLLELKYFKETGKHLDLENMTLCNGSRRPDESVPSLGWYEDELSLVWWHSSASDEDIRSREVVSGQSRGLHMTL